MPIPVLFLYRPLVAALKGVGIRPADAASQWDSFTLGAVFGRLIGGWLMDGNGRPPTRFMLGFCCYFLGSFLAIRASRKRCGSLTGLAILYGTGFGWTIYLPEYGHCTTYGPAHFPKVTE